MKKAAYMPTKDISIQTIKSRIYPIYEKMFDGLGNGEYYPFCFQWGNKMLEEEHSGILFVGKSVNGWVSQYYNNLESLFDLSNHQRIFARDNQMTWVDETAGSKKNSTYNSNRSAFWRLIKKISEEFYTADKWHENLAWSNLYKISHEKGNPNKKLRVFQKEECFKLLKEEIDMLSPEYVVFLTSGWEKSFLSFVNNGEPPTKVKEKDWGKYKSKLYLISGQKIITSYHPQGKNERTHAEAILSLIQPEEGLKT